MVGSVYSTAWRHVNPTGIILCEFEGLSSLYIDIYIFYVVFYWRFLFTRLFEPMYLTRRWEPPRYNSSGMLNIWNSKITGDSLFRYEKSLLRLIQFYSSLTQTRGEKDNVRVYERISLPAIQSIRTPVSPARRPKIFSLWISKLNFLMNPNFLF